MYKIRAFDRHNNLIKTCICEKLFGNKNSVENTIKKHIHSSKDMENYEVFEIKKEHQHTDSQHWTGTQHWISPIFLADLKKLCKYDKIY